MKTPFARTWPDPVPAITQAWRPREHAPHPRQSVQTSTQPTLCTGVLGMRRVKSGRRTSTTRIRPLMRVTGRTRARSSRALSGSTRTRCGRIGTGQTHHFAFAVKDEEEQLGGGLLYRAACRPSWIASTSRAFTPAIDGHRRLATLGPRVHLGRVGQRSGQGLILPPWRTGFRIGDRVAAEAVTHPVETRTGRRVLTCRRCPTDRTSAEVLGSGVPLDGARAVGILLHGRGPARRASSSSGPCEARAW
jgi:hypothetical protein